MEENVGNDEQLVPGWVEHELEGISHILPLHLSSLEHMSFINFLYLYWYFPDHLGTAWRLISHFLEEQILCLAVTSQH